MTLFFTELWERFGYYGMRALLILYMTDAARGGLGMETEISGAIYGLFTFGVYALALPGGWIADRVLGQRQAVFVGGVIIAAGYYSLGLPLVLPGSEIWSFYLGLLLVVVRGTVLCLAGRGAESLAGRIVYHELSPLDIFEIEKRDFALLFLVSQPPAHKKRHLLDIPDKVLFSD
jgi:POT family proton-dependent oligopeptide transporter